MPDERNDVDEAEHAIEEAIKIFNRRRAERPNPLRVDPRDRASPLRNPAASTHGGKP